MTLQLLDVVRALVDLPEQGITRGMVGTIVHVFEQPQRAYEVEFTDEQGRTLAEWSLLPEQVELVTPSRP